MLRGVSSNIASFSQMFRQKDKKPTFCSVGSRSGMINFLVLTNPFLKGWPWSGMPLITGLVTSLV
jgi:hypothetical protein